MKNRSCLSDNNITRLSEADREAIVTEVSTDFSESDKILRNWKNNINTYYELYQMVQRKKHYDGLATIFVPETLRAVETIVGLIYGMIFSDPLFMEYAGRDNGGDNGPAIALTQLNMYQMDQNNFKSKVMDSLRQMVIAGLTVRKILWDFEEVSRRKASYDVEGQRKLEVFSDTVADTWTFEPVDLLTFQISDINVPYNNVQKASWIGEQYMVSKKWIKEKVRKGWLSEKELEKLEEQPEASSSTVSSNVDSRLASSGFIAPSKKGKYELMERWGLFPCKYVYTQDEMKAEGYDEDDLCECVVIIANNTVLLKLEKNPFWHNQKPYVVCPYLPKEFELPGMGVAQIGQSLQEEINDTRNQTMDNKTLILATMWLKTRGSNIKNEELTIRPNGVINTNDINGLVPLRPPVVFGHGLTIDGISKDDLRQSVGAASNLQGIAQSGVNTATESSQINASSMGRTALSAQLYAELVLKPTFIFAEYNNYQFYDHVKAISVIGDVGVKFIPIKPEDIAGGNKDVIIKIASDRTENPAIQRQQLMTFYTSLSQMPPQAIQFHYKMLDRIYGMFFNGHSLSELYPGLAPIDKDELNTPQDERDIILAGKDTKPQQGQDHQEHVNYLKGELEQLKWVLSQVQFSRMKNLILTHIAMGKQEVEVAHQQLIQQQMQANLAAQGAPSGPNKAAPNASVATATPAPTTGSLAQGVQA